MDSIGGHGTQPLVYETKRDAYKSMGMKWDTLDAADYPLGNEATTSVVSGVIWPEQLRRRFAHVLNGLCSFVRDGIIDA